MKPKLKLIIWIVVLAVIIGASALLYQFLSKNYSPENDIGNATENLSSDTSANSDGFSSGQTDESSSSEPEKVLAPDFSVVDGDGNTVKLSDFLGKPVVINFWASWCPPCKSEMPEFDTVWKEVGEDVAFLMVNVTDGQRETQEKAKKYISSKKYKFPVYYDTNQEASYAYGISSLPTTLFIDKDGYLVTGSTGMINESTLRKGIALINQ